MNFSNKSEFLKQAILYNCYKILLTLFDNKSLITKKIDLQSKNLYRIIKDMDENNNIKNNYFCFYNLAKYLSIPNIDFINLYKKGAKKLVYNGLIIEEKINEKYYYYGELYNELGLDLIANICLTKKYNIMNIDNLLFDSNWIYNKPYLNQFKTIIRLMVLAMNNDFYDNGKNCNKSIIDNKIYLKTKKGVLFQIVFANDFLYGLIYDGLYTEKQFDKYSIKGTYKLLCEKFDILYHDIINDKIIDKNIIKQEIITIGAMFNNKMYYLSHYKVIDESTKKRLIHNFNIIFKQNIKEYKLEFTNEDLFKITELVNKTKERLES